MRPCANAVAGVGGAVTVAAPEAAPLDAYGGRAFDLVLLATKAHDAVALAPRLATLLADGGTLLPIQNGAVAGTTMRAYIADADGRALFERTYDEALVVALAAGAAPVRMLVEPIPPRDRYDAWLGEVLAGYGDVKPSMLQDFERGRPTEIDFINGWVVRRGHALGVPTPLNAAIVETVHAISAGRLAPSRALLGRILRQNIFHSRAD